MLSAAAPAGAAIKEVGIDNGERFQTPSCPTDCSALARVTGYQVQVGRSKNPYQINRRGKIVAFTIALGKPSRRHQRFFETTYGGAPQVRLSILRLGRRNREATLVGQSEVFNVEDYLGSAPQFALNRPLRVGPRHVVALTVPTWAPAFATDLSASNAWRAPRNPRDCEDLDTPVMHQTIGTVRAYRCFYRTARVLYSASFIPDPKPTTTTRSDGDQR